MKNNVVLKYDVEKKPGERFTIMMPAGAQILCVQKQKTPFGSKAVAETHMMWVHANKNRQPKAREFMWIGTGHMLHVEPGRKMNYIATTQTPSGLVWHLFEHGFIE